MRRTFAACTKYPPMLSVTSATPATSMPACSSW